MSNAKWLEKVSVPKYELKISEDDRLNTALKTFPQNLHTSPLPFPLKVILVLVNVF